MRSPGVRVAIGLNSPRISSEASGFMSKVSICESPPDKKMKMTYGDDKIMKMTYGDDMKMTYGEDKKISHKTKKATIKPKEHSKY